MSQLAIDTTTGPEHIAEGRRRTVGRDGSIVLRLPDNRLDEHLHAEAYGVTAYPDAWGVDVERGHRPVTVENLFTGEEVTVHGGTQVKFTWELGRVTVTGSIDHHISISAGPLAANRARRRNTLDLFKIDLRRRDHRVAVASCRDLLRSGAARPVPFGEVAAMLSTCGPEEDRSITEGAARTAFFRLLPEIEVAMYDPRWNPEPERDVTAPRERNDARRGEAVTWLVKAGAVTSDMYLELLGSARR